MAAVLIACGSVLVSCKKSNADLIKDYEKVCNEMVEATQNGDLPKVQKLGEKIANMKSEFEGRDFTPEEQQQIAIISMETIGGVRSNTTNLLQGAGVDMDVDINTEE